MFPYSSQQKELTRKREIAEKVVRKLKGERRRGDRGLHNDGDLEMYSNDNLLLRKLCKQHPDVLGALDKWWSVVDLMKDDEGNLGRREYVTMHMKLQKANGCGFTSRKARLDSFLCRIRVSI